MRTVTWCGKKGSHVKFAKTEGGVTRTAVLKQAGIDIAEFDAL